MLPLEGYLGNGGSWSPRDGGRFDSDCCEKELLWEERRGDWLEKVLVANVSRAAESGGGGGTGGVYDGLEGRGAEFGIGGRGAC